MKHDEAVKCTSCQHMRRVLIDHNPDGYAFVCDRGGKLSTGVMVGNVLDNALSERNSGDCGVDAKYFQKWESGIQNHFDVTINVEGRVISLSPYSELEY